MAVLVEAATASSVELARRVNRTGTLRARREIKVITQEEGRITRLPFFEGDRVRKGDHLFELDDTLLRAQLKKTTAQRQQAEQDVKRIAKLQRTGVVAEDELSRARTALDVARADEELLRARLGYTRMEAPFDGLISARLAEPGDIAQRFDQLLTLTDPDSLVTEVTVSELLLPGLVEGDPVEVTIDALGSQVHMGRILRIYPTVDPSSRQGVVEVMLEPAPTGARPGQLCRVHLSSRPSQRLLIPFGALRRDAQGEFVYRIDAQNKAQQVRVISGEHFAEQVEIIEGLAAGERIVTKGFFDLKPGSEVVVAAPPVDAKP